MSGPLVSIVVPVYNVESYGSSSKVPFNKEVNGHSSWVTVKSPYEPKLKRGFEELPYIEECLQSVCSQTYENLEIICVDDVGNDRSMDVVRSFAVKDCRIKNH